MAMNKLTTLKSREYAVELLALLKKKYGYRKLSQLLGLPAPVISRYVNGRVLPSFSRSEKIISLFKEHVLTQLVSSALTKLNNGVYDVNNLITDTTVQRLIARVVFNEFSYVNVQKILTVATNGIPIAVHVANEFNTHLVIAKKSREVSSEDYVEHKIVRAPTLVEYLYIPKRALKRGEHVLIVDDIVRTGATIYSLAGIAEKAGTRVVGVFVVASVGESVENLRERLGVSYPIKSLINLP